jgi:outer membrane receptor protein involved in Fe transport
VLRGPQGTLYGAGTMGGAVRYIPQRPQTDAFSYQVRGDVYDLSHSGDAGYEGGGTVNIPLIDDTLAFRASVDYADDPGFIDYNYLVREAGVSYPQPIPGIPASFDRDANLKSKKDANDENTWSGRAALRYTGDWLDGNLTYYYQDDDIGARQVNHRAAYGTGKYESAHRFLEPNSRKNELLSLELVADLGFAELTSATGYSEYSEHGHRDQTDLLLALEYSYEFFPSFSAYTRETDDQDIFTQELRLVSKSEGPWNWIVGAFYNNLDNDAQSEEFTPGFDQFAVDELGGVQLRPDSLEYYQTFKEHQKETAGFGEIGYQFTDAWQVTVGARWFKYDYEASNGLDLPLYYTVYEGRTPQDLIAPEIDTGKTDDDDVVFKINTSYQFDDEIMGYATISEGYRLGASNAIAACMGEADNQQLCALKDEQTFKSDTSVNYEIGVKTQFSDAVVFNAAVYYIDWEDPQLDSVTVNGALPITANGKSAESYGTELDGTWYITPDFSVTGSYAYNNAQLTEDVPGLFSSPFCGDGTKEDRECWGYNGDRLPGTPKHQFYLAGHYELGLNDGSQLAFDASMTAQSNVLTKAGKRDYGEKLSGFAIYNVSSTWFKDAWQVTLYVDNVFDEYTVTGVRTDTSFIRDVDQFTLRRYFQNMVRPRQAGLKFIYNFES